VTDVGIDRFGAGPRDLNRRDEKGTDGFVDNRNRDYDKHKMREPHAKSGLERMKKDQISDEKIDGWTLKAEGGQVYERGACENSNPSKDNQIHADDES
jgi:hypothetical protein